MTSVTSLLAFEILSGICLSKVLPCNFSFELFVVFLMININCSFQNERISNVSRRTAMFPLNSMKVYAALVLMSFESDHISFSIWFIFTDVTVGIINFQRNVAKKYFFVFFFFLLWAL